METERINGILDNLITADCRGKKNKIKYMLELIKRKNVRRTRKILEERLKKY